MKLTVVHLEGSRQGQTQHFPGPLVQVGRDPSCQLAFDAQADIDVSARHASISFQGQQVMLQDLGSTNGTYLNGTKVDGAVPLPSDAVVQFGEGGPKVRLAYVFGAGKKTAMIHEMGAKLEEAETAQQKAQSRGRLMACCFALVLLLGVGGFFVVSSFRSAAAAKAEVSGEGGLKDQAVEAGERAKTLGAEGHADSKETYEKGLTQLGEGDAAVEAGDYALAKKSYQAAQASFETARDQATAATLAAAEAKAKQLEEKRRREDAKRQAELDKIKQDNEKKLAELQARLEEASAKDLLDELKALLGSNDPKKIERGIEELQGRLKDDPESAELKDLLARFEARLAELSDVEGRLEKVATQAKSKVVGIHTRLMALPKGVEDKPSARLLICRHEGTGFFASSAGLILTSREVAEPWLFEAESLALYEALKERDAKFFTIYEVFTRGTKEGLFTRRFAGEQVKLMSTLDTTPGGERSVTVKIGEDTLKKKVRPHRRDANDVALLKADTQGQAHLELAEGEVEAGQKFVALGTQIGGPGIGKQDMGLFRFLGEVKTKTERLELLCPSFPSWSGGPVLDPDGKVLGLLVDSGTKESRAADASKLRELVQ